MSANIFKTAVAVMLTAEVNISSYPGTLVPGLFFHSRAVIFKSGCFVQKYWSGTVMRNTVMQRAADYLDLTKPNLAALDYTAAVRTCGTLNLQIHAV